MEQHVTIIVAYEITFDFGLKINIGLMVLRFQYGGTHLRSCGLLITMSNE